ncbi:tetratricopeptide repeat protein [Kitasatospora sp. GP82]|uniref:tetratricopeptide repeat protein n=1 Tax=Kitasatospora sp. GP82 TaxID=3035089 RepID=UPI0024759427|nr:tetratricopeptide repeat protein [Kitasatospora sp. GP82]MDH6128908.1 tetratricopeptide (TPR) repeat protein [Kitasatospora sp. GP82]
MEALSLPSLVRALERIGPTEAALGPLAGHLPLAASRAAASRAAASEAGVSEDLAWAVSAGRALWARAEAEPAVAELLRAWWRGLAGVADMTVNQVSGEAEIGTLVQAGSIGQINLHPPALPPRAPQQLPFHSGNFVDRDDERASCTAVLDRPGEGRPAVLVLSGVGGVGKSALSRRWGHEVRGQFPDGVLYADLGRLRRDGGVDLAEVLADFLEALGVHRFWHPKGLARLQARFRSETHGRRLLVVLDDVLMREEAEALLPGDERSVVLVTSPRRQYDLEDEGAVAVPIGVLSQEHAEDLLAALIGRARAAAEPDAVAALARWCGGLPIALRVAGGQLARRRRSTVADLVDELASADRAAGAWESKMWELWDGSYRTLSQRAARLYRLLAHHPGVSFTPAAAAAATALSLAETEEALDELLTASLLEEDGDGRLGYHRPLREHARRVAQTEDPRGAERQASWLRTVRWYARQAERADRIALGTRLRYLTPLPDCHGPDVPFADAAEANGWFWAERYTLLGCMHEAFDLGEDELVCRLAEPLWALVMNYRPYAYWIAAYSMAVEAAERSEDLLQLARFRSQLARAYWELGDMESAHAELGPALAAARAAQDERAEASVLEFTGKAYLAEQLLDRTNPANELLDKAEDAFREALRINESLHRSRGARLQLHHLGQVSVRRGRWEEAAEVLVRAFELGAAAEVSAAGGSSSGPPAVAPVAPPAGLSDGGPDERTSARIATTLGSACLQLGQYERALELLDWADEIVRRRDTPMDEAPILESLSRAADAQGDTARAREYLARALAIHEATGSPRAAELRAALDSYGEPES